MKINVVIPTYKRWDALVGLAYFGKFAKWVLPESQKDEYSKVLTPKQMIIIPDEDDGNIVKKRNWILKNVKRPLLMIDDDVKSIWYWEDRHDEYLRRLLPKDIAPLFIQRGFELAKEWGCVFWGIAQNTDDRVYLDFKPFSLVNAILGPFQGHFDHDFLFDARMGTKEDYDMSLQILNKHKKILRINKFAYECVHGDNKGGIVSFRTMKKEIEWCRAIERKWGRKIIKYPLRPTKMVHLLNWRIDVPIRGV